MFDAVGVADEFRLGAEWEALVFFVAEEAFVNEVDERAADAAAGAGVLGEHANDIAGLLVGCEAGDPGVVGFFAVFDGLCGAGFGGDFGFADADFAGGAAGVHGEPHAFAD